MANELSAERSVEILEGREVIELLAEGNKLGE